MIKLNILLNCFFFVVCLQLDILIYVQELHVSEILFVYTFVCSNLLSNTYNEKANKRTSNALVVFKCKNELVYTLITTDFTI